MSATASQTQAPPTPPWIVEDPGDSKPEQRLQSTAPPLPTAPSLPTAPVPQQPQQPSESQLRQRREELASQVAELHWNLGGLAYEMAIRDHFRLDVLLRRAAMLQEREIELNELDRVLNHGA